MNKTVGPVGIEKQRGSASLTFQPSKRLSIFLYSRTICIKKTISEGKLETIWLENGTFFGN